MKLLMLKGLPGSGKTHYAKQLCKDGWVRVNKDDLRAMLHDSHWSKHNEKQVIAIRNIIIEQAFKDGKSVVVDDTNFAKYHENTLKGIADRHEANFSTKFIDTPLQVCINRDIKRANGVGKDVIMSMYNKYLKPTPKVPLATFGAKKAIIVDIDGTLAHMNGRSPYDWDQVMTDLPDRQLIELVQNIKDKYTIILLSGRDGSCYEQTKHWLIAHDVPHDYLFMREAGDKRKDSIIKKEIFDRCIQPNFNVQFVLDDRNQVVEMWRQLGLKCYQVAEGDF